TATFAQAQTAASISGKISGPSGAGLSAATITVTSVETGATRTATSGDDGNYKVLSLPVGAQEIKAEKQGFKTQLRKGINLEVGQQAVVNLRLEVGELSQQITVSEEVPVVIPPRPKPPVLSASAK